MAVVKGEVLDGLLVDVVILHWLIELERVLHQLTELFLEAFIRVLLEYLLLLVVQHKHILVALFDQVSGWGVLHD